MRTIVLEEHLVSHISRLLDAYEKYLNNDKSITAYYYSLEKDKDNLVRARLNLKEPKISIDRKDNIIKL